MMEESNEGGGKNEGIRGGVRQGWGFLTALKDAIEDTLAESRERGDLSPDRATDALRSAIERAQEAAGEARDRLDFATRREMEALEGEVARLSARLDLLDGGGPPADDADEALEAAPDGDAESSELASDGDVEGTRSGPEAEARTGESD